jgi:hypothetical protein
MSQPFDNRDWDVLEIQQKDAEIERLKGELASQRKLSDGDYNRLMKELERLKALLIRAADALDRPETRAWHNQWTESLIAELRKTTK